MSSSLPSSDETCINDAHDGKKRKKSCVIMMARLTKVYDSGRKFMFMFDMFYRVVGGDYSLLFKSYVVFLGRSKVNILIDDWKEEPMDVKDDIWTKVMVLILIFMYSISLYIIYNTYLLM